MRTIQTAPRSLPTQFAVILATACDLYVPPEEEQDNQELWLELRDRLINFQKLSLATDFDTAMIAYHEFELSDHQLEQLQIIHSSTEKWLLGHVAEQLLIRLEKSATSQRDAKEIAEIIIQNFGKRDEKEDADKDKKEQRKGLLVRFADVDEELLEKDYDNKERAPDEHSQGD